MLEWQLAPVDDSPDGAIRGWFRCGAALDLA
jgi:hypothetical protein